MSDLQVSLLIIGLVVIGAVVVLNWLQQWRLRRKLEQGSHEQENRDLLRGSTDKADTRERHVSGAGRVEPVISPSATPSPRIVTAGAEIGGGTPPLPPVPGFDTEIDFVVAVDADEPISAAGLAELHTKAAACGRPFRAAGYNFAEGGWEEAARLSGGRYKHIRLALQLVNRKGPVDLGALTMFCAAAQECAARFSANATCPDIEAGLDAARELDAFCADVDITIGVNVVANDGDFNGNRIRALAQSAGLELERDGLFHYRDDAGQTLFTLENQDSTRFVPEETRQITTPGVTLLLEVPRVKDGEAALAHMLAVGVELARGLGGALVDDNRVALSDNAARAIQQQVRSIQAKMQTRGIAPGSDRALRLFS